MESKVPNTIRMSLAQRYRNNLSERIELISVLLERFNGRQLSQRGLISELRASAIRITDAFLKLCETKTTHELVLADVIQSLSNNCALKPPTGSSSDLRHQSKPPSSTDFIRHMYGTSNVLLLQRETILIPRPYQNLHQYRRANGVLRPCSSRAVSSPTRCQLQNWIRCRTATNAP